MSQPRVHDAADAFDALSLSPNEREHPCWGCGKPAPPLDQKPFGRCDLCAEAKYAVCARFCSNACPQKHRLRHKEWHEKKDACIEDVASQPNLAALRREAAKDEAEAKDEYSRLVAQAYEAAFRCDLKAAVKLAKAAIKLDPDKSCAHFVLGNAHGTCGDYLRASECYLAAMERDTPDSEGWAYSTRQAWDTRRRAQPCNSDDLFCGCKRCAALPEKPEWMSSPQTVAPIAERVVAAQPQDAAAWWMHAKVNHEIRDWCTASKSYMKAGKLFGDRGQPEEREECLRAAKEC